MLQIIRSIKELPFSKWMEVYTESNRKSGREDYPDLSEYRQLINAEQDHFQYLREVFFTTENAFCAAWRLGDRYAAALRAEPYRDGYLITALETAPEARGKGYATALVEATLPYIETLGSRSIYAHVSKDNAQSLAVHKSCGFEIMLDHAVYIDGSVLQSAYTLRNQK